MAARQWSLSECKIQFNQLRMADDWNVEYGWRGAPDMMVTQAKSPGRLFGTQEQIQYNNFIWSVFIYFIARKLLMI